MVVMQRYSLSFNILLICEIFICEAERVFRVVFVVVLLVTYWE